MDPIKPSADLFSQQLDLEQEMASMGYERVMQRHKTAQEIGMEDRTGYGLAMIDTLMSKVSAGILGLINERENGKAGRRGIAVKVFQLYDGDYDAISYMALRQVVASLSSDEVNLSTLSLAIGTAVAEELIYREVREEDKKVYKKMAEEAKERSALHSLRRRRGLKQPREARRSNTG